MFEIVGAVFVDAVVVMVKVWTALVSTPPCGATVVVDLDRHRRRTRRCRSACRSACRWRATAGCTENNELLLLLTMKFSA